MRLIDAEKLHREVKEHCKKLIDAGVRDVDVVDIAAEIGTLLQDTQTVGAVPVMHSYWEAYSCSQYMGTDEFGEPKWRDGRFYICHNYRCRRKTVVKSNYCPNCGAKMDADTQEREETK